MKLKAPLFNKLLLLNCVLHPCACGYVFKKFMILYALAKHGSSSVTADTGHGHQAADRFAEARPPAASLVPLVNDAHASCITCIRLGGACATTSTNSKTGRLGIGLSHQVGGRIRYLVGSR